MPIAGPEGMRWSKALAQKEGIFTGISGGSAFAVARQIAETGNQGRRDLGLAGFHPEPGEGPGVEATEDADEAS